MELYPIDIAIHLVNIVVLYLLLRTILWKPVRKFMAAREQRIEEQTAQAATLHANAEIAKADYEARLAKAAERCEELLAEGRQQAAEEKARLLEESKRESRDIVAKARLDAEEERTRALDCAKRDLADLAVGIAARILQFDDAVRENVRTENMQKTGTQVGTLKVARALDAQELSIVTERLERLLGCHLTLDVMVDETLIGGFAAYVGGKVYDFSYAAQLATMKQRLA